MRSIRAQLLGWLLPGFAAMCIIAGASFYWVARHAFEADLDARLVELSEMAHSAFRGRMGGKATAALQGRRVAPNMEKFLAREEFTEPGQYFQEWTPDGTLVRKSPNLGNMDLPRPGKILTETMKLESTLPNGDPVSVRIVQLTAGGGGGGGGRLSVNFAVAISRHSINTRLTRLRWELVAGSVLGCIMLSGLLAVALRVAMRPLERLGEQAAGMNANSLQNRFPMDDMPTEMVPIVARLNDLMARLEQSFERERRFSGDLAHDLRTPLAAIRTASEVAAKWPEQSNTEDFQEIAQIAAQLQQTVDSLLMLARTEMPNNKVSKEPILLRPLVEECVAAYAEKARKRNLTLSIQLNPSFTLQTDARLLRAIITNLVSNAISYAPEGSETFITGANTDTILRISNAAPALTPDDIPHLFERLWRKSRSRTDDTHAGLGLAIAASSAQALGLILRAELDAHGMLHLTLT